jgi:hypothetical protein
VASTELTPVTHRRWRTAALVVGVINLILALIDLGLSVGSGIPAVYLVSVVLLANAVICFAFARFLKSSL